MFNIMIMTFNKVIINYINLLLMVDKVVIEGKDSTINTCLLIMDVNFIMVKLL